MIELGRIEWLSCYVKRRAALCLACGHIMAWPTGNTMDPTRQSGKQRWFLHSSIRSFKTSLGDDPTNQTLGRLPAISSSRHLPTHFPRVCVEKSYPYARTTAMPAAVCILFQAELNADKIGSGSRVVVALDTEDQSWLDAGASHKWSRITG